MFIPILAIIALTLGGPDPSIICPADGPSTGPAIVVNGSVRPEAWTCKGGVLYGKP